AAALLFVRRHGWRRCQADGRLRSLGGSFGDLAGGGVSGGFRRPLGGRHPAGSVDQSVGWRSVMHFDRRFVLVISMSLAWALLVSFAFYRLAGGSGGRGRAASEKQVVVAT